MKSSLLSPLLFLSLLILEAQGIRSLKKGSLPITQQSLSTSTYLKAFSEIDNEDVDEAVNSASRFSASARKLMNTPTIPTTTTIAKNVNKEKTTTKEENLAVDLSSTTEQPVATAQETYSDIVDITGMDYSPAKRKPPIHN